LYKAYQAAAEDARNTSRLGVPIHLRNAPTKFMKNIGYGKDYKYNPDYEEPVEQEYLPKELKGRKYLKK
jgi:putative ATPase